MGEIANIKIQRQYSESFTIKTTEENIENAKNNKYDTFLASNFQHNGRKIVILANNQDVADKRVLEIEEKAINDTEAVKAKLQGLYGEQLAENITIYYHKPQTRIIDDTLYEFEETRTNEILNALIKATSPNVEVKGGGNTPYGIYFDNELLFNIKSKIGNKLYKDKRGTLNKKKYRDKDDDEIKRLLVKEELSPRLFEDILLLLQFTDASHLSESLVTNYININIKLQEIFKYLNIENNRDKQRQIKKNLSKTINIFKDFLNYYAKGSGKDKNNLKNKQRLDFISDINIDTVKLSKKTTITITINLETYERIIENGVNYFHRNFFEEYQGKELKLYYILITLFLLQVKNKNKSKNKAIVSDESKIGLTKLFNQVYEFGKGGNGNTKRDFMALFNFLFSLVNKKYLDFNLEPRSKRKYKESELITIDTFNCEALRPNNQEQIEERAEQLEALYSLFINDIDLVIEYSFIGYPREEIIRTINQQRGGKRKRNKKVVDFNKAKYKKEVAELKKAVN